MGDFDYTYPIIHNKVASPRYVTPILRRGRLLDWLHANANSRAIVLAADAGYGKTTLLWQWEREVTFPCYWYKLDANDRDWSLHITYLVEAIRQRHPGFGKRTTSMLRQLGGPGTSRPGVAAYLLSEMHERLTEPCTIVVDDWQYVANVTEVRGLWNQILRDAPPTCRFVFSSRVKPRLQFARFKTHGGYAQLSTDDFRFTDDEIDRLFKEIYQDPLDPAELTELERKTEGWAASLQLVEVSLRERATPEARRDFIESVTRQADSDLFAYLAEEVLDQQTEQTRNFLLSTSILSQITGELAERLAGIQDGTRELTDLEQRGLFTYRLDDSRYRYHHLFREFLESRLASERSDAEVSGLHIHAASYYETTAQWPEAIHHYLKAGLQRQAARLIARYGEEVVSEGRLGMVDEWVAELPGRTVRENARLSLLQGETLGMRGDWEAALSALTRAREFFKRKGDRRMEALACLKLSTVHGNRGNLSDSVTAAEEGLALAPDDAVVIRMRLSGNRAVTAQWMTDPAGAARQLRRLAVEADTMGLEHYSAIAYHNLGMLERELGNLAASRTCLERARRTWSVAQHSPFADNFELTTTLLMTGEASEAARVAEAGVASTAPWPRPHAESLLGAAAVRIYGGDFYGAAEICHGVLSRPESLGSEADAAFGLLIDAMFLADANQESMADANENFSHLSHDERQRLATTVARALAVHKSGLCRGECSQTIEVIREWDRRGRHAAAAIAKTKVSLVTLEHRHRDGLALASEALRDVIDGGLATYVKWWLRRLEPHLGDLANELDAPDFVSLLESDVDFWRHPLARLIPHISGDKRASLLQAVARVGNRETIEVLRSMRGADIAEVRRNLIRDQAPRLFVRAFGALTLHRGAWRARPIRVPKRRLRMLLGLLVARVETGLTRDEVLDLLWPNSDPAAAVNSLNQTVFQLRHLFDPSYRDADSPPYLVSDVDSIHLNTELVRTDLQEIRRLSVRVTTSPTTALQAAAAEEMVGLISGEYLADVRYEDWAAAPQLAAHTEVRRLLMPLATRQLLPTHGDLALRAAQALATLDPLDEAAHIAIAEQLSIQGQRSAARETLTTLARRLERELDEAPSRDLSAALARVGVKGDLTKTAMSSEST